MKVKNRDNELIDFDEQKIVDAIKGAYPECSEEELNKITEVVNQDIDKLESVSVEDIQYIVQIALMKTGHYDEAVKFIEYKFTKSKARTIRDRMDYMENYSNAEVNAATASATDSNANMNIKNAANLEAEVYKPENRLTQRSFQKKTLKHLYPNTDLHKQYIKDLEHHIIYAHDEASSPVPYKYYCQAVSLYPLVLDGTSPMDGTGTKKPKNLDSFCGQLINLTFLLSSCCKGAVAFGEFFNFMDYYCVKEFGENYNEKEDLYADSEFVVNRKTISQKIEQAFQRIVYNWNQPAGNRGYQSPFINISYYDSYYWNSLFEDFVFPDGSTPKWRRVDYLQKKFLHWFTKEQEKVVLTFPVCTMALLHDGTDVKDNEYAVLTAEAQAENAQFFVYLSDSVDSLASCCRLRNQLSKNVFSFTNGLTGVQTGSCNVITLNLNRITQDYWRLRKGDHMDSPIYERDFYEGFKDYLITILERVYCYHIAFKTKLYEAESKGLITSSKAGYIDMHKLYSTIGINGLNEAALFLGMTISDNEEYANFVNLVTTTISEQNRLHSNKDFMFNTELVPAEDLGVKNFNWDKEDGYYVPTDGRNLFNSYIYDAHNPNISILEKIRMHGKKYTGNLDGGVGCHLNIDEDITPTQAMAILKYAIKVGCSYYTFNRIFSVCNKCGKVIKKKVDVCPECGSSDITYWTRIIGYLRPITKWSAARFKEFFRRAFLKTGV